MPEKTVLYGIQGEGRGHASRSLHLIGHLKQRGYKIYVLSGGDALSLLSGQTLPIHRIPLFRLLCNANGELQIVKTFYKNLFLALGLIFKAGRPYSYVRKLVQRIKPDFVITDFEPYLARIAPDLGIPSIAIDHQHIFLESHLPRLKNIKKRFILFVYKIIIHLLCGYPDQIISSSFYHFPSRKKSKSHFVGPYITRKIYDLSIQNCNYITAYLKEPAYIYKLVAAMTQIKEIQFEVFANWSQIPEIPDTPENIKLYPIDQSHFLDSLATSIALISTAGNQVIGEAVFMDKPVFAIPKLRDIEQEINGIGLERSGFGEICQLNNLTPDRLLQFIHRIPVYKQNIFQQKLLSTEFDATEQTLRIIENAVKDWDQDSQKVFEFKRPVAKIQFMSERVTDSLNRLLALLSEK